MKQTVVAPSLNRPDDSAIAAICQVPRIHLRRFVSAVWEEILDCTATLELELDSAKARPAVLNILRRYQKEHGEAYFVVTALEPLLLRIEKQTDMPANPFTGRPCGIRFDEPKPVDEEQVVEDLARVVETFASSLTRREFREFLAQRFQAQVLKGRRQWRRLGLDHGAMCALASGMFEKCANELERQAVRVLDRAGEAA